MTAEITAAELDALEKRVCGDRSDGRVMSGDYLDVIDFRKIIAAARREQKLRGALVDIAEQAESHPAYFQDATDADIDREGGDCAFVTWIARIAREALKETP